jgi:hypothetical protein
MAIWVEFRWQLRRTTNIEHNRAVGDRHTSAIAEHAETP